MRSVVENKLLKKNVENKPSKFLLIQTNLSKNGPFQSNLANCKTFNGHFDRIEMSKTFIMLK